MIKNIIFDLGGVLLDLRIQSAIDAFIRLGAIDFGKHYSLLKQDAVFDSFDKGKIPAAEFRDFFRKKYALTFTNAEFDNAWNAMLGQLPANRLAMLERLKKKYRLFLLSNTNEIHIPAFRKIIDDQHHVSLENYFEKIYLSSAIGMRKPDVMVFEKVLAENDLRAAETIFIDDSPQHIEGAKRAGIHAVLLSAGKDITELIGELLPEL